MTHELKGLASPRAVARPARRCISDAGDEFLSPLGRPTDLTGDQVTQNVLTTGWGEVMHYRSAKGTSTAAPSSQQLIERHCGGCKASDSPLI
jgi:hypothetical protein